MMLAMTGVEEVLADETSFIEDTDASFFFVPFSFSYVNIIIDIRCFPEGGLILP